MVLRPQNYQSMRSNEEQPLLPLSSTSDNGRNSSRASPSLFFRSTWPFLLLLSLLCLGALPVLPTAEEADMAQHYDIPYLVAARKLRRAQRLADAFHLELTSNNDKDFKHVLKDIRKHHNSAEHYMQHPPNNCEATVIILRHCEKGKVREHCAYQGFERSVYLATLFGDDKYERWPRPSFIFAEGPGARNNPKKLNFREIETVGPLAEKSNVTVDDSYNTKTANDLARQIVTFLETGEMCGKVTVIAWKHSSIGHLAHRLGCGPQQGCPLDYKGSSFDEAWQIKYTYRASDHSDRKNLKVSKKPTWKIYGSVQQEGFDPLAFSKRAGDYPPGGTSFAGRWKKSVVEVPERREPGDKRFWKATHVGFGVA